MPRTAYNEFQGQGGGQTTTTVPKSSPRPPQGPNSAIQTAGQTTEQPQVPELTSSQAAVLSFLRRMRLVQSNPSRPCMCCHSISGCWYTPSSVRNAMSDKRRTAGGLARVLQTLTAYKLVEARYSGVTDRGFRIIEYRAAIVE